ncbi:MAG TPA: hypothetical protein VIF11_23335 [Methylomirabilota bacterium]|jgi:hypothetical protein
MSRIGRDAPTIGGIAQVAPLGASHDSRRVIPVISRSCSKQFWDLDAVLRELVYRRLTAGRRERTSVRTRDAETRGGPTWREARSTRAARRGGV